MNIELDKKIDEATRIRDTAIENKNQHGCAGVRLAHYMSMEYMAQQWLTALQGLKTLHMTCEFNQKYIEELQKMLPNKDKELIYLASPYSHENQDVVKRRFHHICYIAGNIIQDDLLVYCPIAHSHPIAKQGVCDTWEMWQPLDLEMLSRCDKLWVAPMAGWEESTGVKAEMERAKELGIPVEHVPEKYLVF
jgi:hypothetical protein